VLAPFQTDRPDLNCSVAGFGKRELLRNVRLPISGAGFKISRSNPRAGRSLMHGVAPQLCRSSSPPIVRRRSRGSLPRLHLSEDKRAVVAAWFSQRPIYKRKQTAATVVRLSVVVAGARPQAPKAARRSGHGPRRVCMYPPRPPLAHAGSDLNTL
jgi:hypothetical protein